jgi:hypothetical protein
MRLPRYDFIPIRGFALVAVEAVSSWEGKTTLLQRQINHLPFPFSLKARLIQKQRVFHDLLDA